MVDVSCPSRPAKILAGLRALLAGVVLSALTVLSSAASAAVWKTTGQWDDDAEHRYSQWVERNFHSNFFFENSPYADIATDCADASYGMRIAFAAEHGLPFVIRQPDAPAQFITQATHRFDHLPAGTPRVRAFMNWVMSITGTASLVHDTYPVKIDREQIRPGIIYLSWRTHAMQVVSLRPTGVIRYLESTAPRAIRPMRSILGFPRMVPADPRARQNGDGFRRFKRPQDYGKPEHLLPGYGLEQFEQARRLQRENITFYDWVQSQLAYEPEPVAQRARRTVFALCEISYDRASAVDEAQTLLADLKRQGRRRMSPAQADEHSTPTRDALLARAFEHLPLLIEHPDWPAVQGRYRGFVDLLTGRLSPDQVDRVRAELLGWCNLGGVDGGPGRPMDLLELQGLLRDRRLSSDPHASLAERWGLAGGPASDGRPGMP